MKIIYYMPLFLKEQAQRESNKKLLDFCELFKIVSPNASLIDRSNALETPFETKILYGIPPKPEGPINLLYDEVCINRAKEILKESKDIVIFYSGGLDSTVVVLSFWIAIQNGIGNYNQITIAASQHSIIENPKFWNKIILPYFKLTSANTALDNINNPNTTVDRYVMGENADQLFGGGLLHHVMDFFDEEINEDNIEKMFIISKVNETAKPYLHRVLRNLVENATVPLNTMADLRWWLNFSCKWQSVALRTLCFTNFLDVITHDSELKIFDTFFNTPDFQILSLFGNMPKWGSPPSRYNHKLASRLFIEKYIDLGNYTTTKIKVPSLYRILVTGTYKYNALGIEDNRIYRIQNIEINKE